MAILYICILASGDESKVSDSGMMETILFLRTAGLLLRYRQYIITLTSLN